MALVLEKFDLKTPKMSGKKIEKKEIEEGSSIGVHTVIAYGMLFGLELSTLSLIYLRYMMIDVKLSNKLTIDCDITFICISIFLIKHQ